MKNKKLKQLSLFGILVLISTLGVGTSQQAILVDPLRMPSRHDREECIT